MLIAVNEIEEGKGGPKCTHGSPLESSTVDEANSLAALCGSTYLGPWAPSSRGQTM